nr:MAG TPA: hypothetical protein [Caudoviricetes sp.]
MITIRLQLRSKRLFGQNKWPINEKAQRRNVKTKVRLLMRQVDQTKIIRTCFR